MKGHICRVIYHDGERLPTMFAPRKTLDPWTAVNVDSHFEVPFLGDGYTYNEQMRAQYEASAPLLPPPGLYLKHQEILFKNVSIFDLTGRKLTWGDIRPEDVLGMKGVYYVLSQHKSFFDVPQDENISPEWDFRSEDQYSESTLRDNLPLTEPARIPLDYIKANAIARIVNGRIHTSRELVFTNY